MIKEAIVAVACSWGNPGHDPYVGDRLAAIDSFAMPRSIRQELKRKVAAGESDGTVAITKTGAVSESATYHPLMLMHFGRNRLCWGVDRSAWADNHVEYGPLYCASTYCITIPDVCGNVTQLFGRQPWSGQERPGAGGRGPEWSTPQQEVYTVPEPGSIALTWLAGMAAMFVFWRK